MGDKEIPFFVYGLVKSEKDFGDYGAGLSVNGDPKVSQHLLLHVVVPGLLTASSPEINPFPVARSAVATPATT